VIFRHSIAAAHSHSRKAKRRLHSKSVTRHRHPKTMVFCRRALWVSAVLVGAAVITVALTPANPQRPTGAATTNIAEDVFLRPNTTAGWGTTTNFDGVPNFTWSGDLGTNANAQISNDTGIITYTGTDGHRVAGYVDTPVQAGGDVLAEFSFGADGLEQCGVIVQRMGTGQWYQADLNTALGVLQLIKRYSGRMYVEASIAFAAQPNVRYWIRLDAQPGASSELLRARVWKDGTPEPTAWQVSYTDPNPLPAGYPGAMGDWFAGPLPGEAESFEAWAYANPGPAVPPEELVSPSITSSASTSATVGEPFSFAVTATGSPSPTLSATNSTLPPGVTFTDNGGGQGTLSGTPTSSGTFAIVLNAANGVGSNATQDFELDVGSGGGLAPTFTAESPPTPTGIGGVYNYTFAAGGSPAPTFALASGSLPPGLSLDANSGVLSGTPTSDGNFTFTVSASNGVGDATTPSITISVLGDADVATVLVGPAHATVGSMPYDLTVSNLGPSTAMNITATFTIPSGAAFSSAASGGSDAEGVVTWDVPSLASGSHVHLHLTITSVSPGSYVAYGDANAANPDPNPSNNTASFTTVVKG
jgi:uncharacterized repeat protein (TIGR01451 family)